MSLNRRDVLVAAATASAGALLTTTRADAQSARLPKIDHLQVLMRGLFLLDTEVPASPGAIACYFLEPKGHQVALVARLDDLLSYPDGAAITLDEDGAEIATWTFASRANLQVAENATKGVAMKKAGKPKKWDDIAWIAGMKELGGIDDDLDANHASIRVRLYAETGKLVVLSPSNKKKGDHCWEFKGANGQVTTAQVTDAILYESASDAGSVQITFGAKPWRFKRDNVRVRLTSFPGPGGKDFAHFPHLAHLFGKEIEVPKPVDCATRSPVTFEKLESGTAYCPPGKRP